MTSPTPITQSAPNLDAYREQYSLYARRLLDDLGLGDLGQPQRGQLLLQIETYVQEVMLNTLLEQLDDDLVKEADKILEDGGTNEEAIAYLMLSIPNIDIIMAEALAKSYAEMLEETKQLAEAVAKDLTKKKDPIDKTQESMVNKQDTDESSAEEAEDEDRPTLAPDMTDTP